MSKINLLLYEQFQVTYHEHFMYVAPYIAVVLTISMMMLYYPNNHCSYSIISFFCRLHCGAWIETCSLTFPYRNKYVFSHQYQWKILTANSVLFVLYHQSVHKQRFSNKKKEAVFDRGFRGYKGIAVMLSELYCKAQRNSRLGNKWPVAPFFTTVKLEDIVVSIQQQTVLYFARNTTEEPPVGLFCGAAKKTHVVSIKRSDYNWSFFFPPRQKHPRFGFRFWLRWTTDY